MQSNVQSNALNNKNYGIMLWEGHNDSNVISERAESQALNKVRCPNASQRSETETCPINTRQTTSKYLCCQTVAYQLL